MKNLILFFVAIAAITLFSCSSPSQRNEEKFQKTIKSGDVKIVTSYLEGQKYSKLRPYAIKSALTLIENKEELVSAYSVLERCWPSDSVAKVFYEKNTSNNFDFNHKDGTKKIAKWNSTMDKLLNNLSDDTKAVIKLRVLKGEAPDDIMDGSWIKQDELIFRANYPNTKKLVIHDLLWAQKYLSQEEMEKICLTHVSYRTRYFLHHTPDSVLVNRITKQLPDSLIAMYELGDRVSAVRQLQIAKSLPLKKALDFLWESGQSKYCAEIFNLKRHEASQGKPFEYYHYGCYSKGYLFSELKKMSVSQLTKVYVSWDDYELFHEYALIVIKAVKSKSDYLLAINFFKESGADKELEILRNQAKFRI